MIVNEHYGKVVLCHMAGVEIELIIIEFPVENKPKTVRCIDRTGTRYQVSTNSVKGTDEKVTREEITKIAARAFCGRKEQATSVAR